MGHCRGLALGLVSVITCVLAGCASPAATDLPTAPSALSAPSVSQAGPATILENAPFTGSDSGTFEFTQDICPAGVAPLRTHTTGTATLIGAYSFETRECFDTRTFTFTGSFTITAANGDTLAGSYDGHVTGFLDDVTSSYVFTATISNGTGRFAGATGTIAGTGEGNLATFDESRTFSGRISRVPLRGAAGS